MDDYFVSSHQIDRNVENSVSSALNELVEGEYELDANVKADYFRVWYDKHGETVFYETVEYQILFDGYVNGTHTENFMITWKS